MPLLVDTGILYALADADDDWHVRARDYLARTRELLLTPATVLPEVCYLLRERLGPGAELAFVRSLAAGELPVEDLTARDLGRCGELMERYPQIGFVDASVVAVAERLRIRMLATTDRRHFGTVRPRHATAFQLVP